MNPNDTLSPGTIGRRRAATLPEQPPQLWKSVKPKKAYDAIIVGGGGHGLATAYYLAKTQPWLREVFFGISRSAPQSTLWWDIQPISAGIFGVPVGFAVIILVSLVTPTPSQKTQNLVEQLRVPNL